MSVKFLSWNVNGLRALLKKPHWSFFSQTDAQIVGFQETKASPDQLPEEIVSPANWNAYWDSSQVKKGYSGVAVFSKLSPLAVNLQLPDPRYRGEGRLVWLEFEKFHYFNGYFPNGGSEILDEDGKPSGNFKRLDYKMGFLESFLNLAAEARANKPVIVCGDFNIAHQAIDLANPKANEKNTGFLPVERDWMDRFLNAGFIDTFRLLHPDEKDKYTWWSYKNFARPRNSGWRLDYFFVSDNLKDAVQDAWIESAVEGSDHCPVGLILDI